jgi:exonuclease SbcC
MEPHKLTLTNFIGITSGLNTDTITINFEEIPGELIAIIGPNGKGKTTLLDNMHPFRIMPSRASSYSPKAFSYYEQCGEGIAEKELEWTHEGAKYRSKLVIRQTGKTRKTECFLDILANGAWQSLGDGRTETYDSLVVGILGTPELFFTSAFAAQERPMLSGYSNSDIKGLLTELLNLEGIRVVGQKAKQHRQRSGESLTQLRIERNEYAGLVESKAAQETEHAAAVQGASDANLKMNLLTEALVDARATVQAEAAKAERAAGAEQERDRLTGRKSQMELRRSDMRTDAKSQADELKSNAVIEKSELEGKVNRATARRGSLTRSIDGWKQFASLAPQLVPWGAEELRLTGAISMLKDQLAAIREAAKKHAEWEEEQTKHQRKADVLSSEIANLSDRLDSMNQTAMLINDVPCNDQPNLVSSCLLLQNARDAQDAAVTVVANIDVKKTELKTLGATQALHDKQEPKLLHPESDCQNEIDVKENELATIRVQLNKREMIEQAAGKLESEEAELIEVEGDISAVQTKLTNCDSSLETKLESLRQSLTRNLADVDADIEGVAGQLAVIAVPDAGAEEKAKLDAEDADLAVTAQRSTLERAITSEATVKSRLDVIVERLTGYSEEDPLPAAEDDVAQWKLLERAFGNDGIIALSIDDAGPTIAGLCNDLLLACFGPRFTVAIETETETASNKHKETFDIRVFDAKDDTVKSAGVMSGGQRIWINEALTRSLALFQAQNSGNQYGCLFSDESDGALDAEKKLEFVAMKRQVIRIGGYEREYFISHSESVWGLADSVIDMGKLEKAA